MKYLSLFSGIEAATVAWEPLGFGAVGFAEIEPFPCAVLKHHYPGVPNYGTVTDFRSWPESTFDVLVGGSPCQSFSVAGLRKGLDDPRGNLMLTYLAIADRYRPRWVVWENVPGVLSSSGGRDFGTFLGALEELGYGWAYRVLNAQYVRVDGFARAVPQRRRRVFVVGYLGDWRRAAAVLFERESLSGHPAPRREKREEVAGTIAARFGISRDNHEELAPTWPATVSPTLNAHFGDKQGLEDQHALNGAGCFVPDVSRCVTAGEGFRLDFDSCTQIPVLAPALTASIDWRTTQVDNELTGTLKTDLAHQSGPIIVSPALTASNDPSRSPQSSEVAQQVEAVIMATAGPLYDSHDYNQDRIYGVGGATEGLTVARKPNFMVGMQVRRLTPTECERLQGFPDSYTNIPWRGNSESPDGPRYKALGNSMAVNVMRWIGERIKEVDTL